METSDARITTLKDLLDHNARRFTLAEIQLSAVLPTWIHQATEMKLKSVLQRYLDFALKNSERLNSFMREEEIGDLSVSNKVMDALIEDTSMKLASCADPEVRDACLLASVQSINHFKISIYGTAAAFAKTVGKGKAGELFHELEANEKQIDDRLSQLAEFEINAKAKLPPIFQA